MDPKHDRINYLYFGALFVLLLIVISGNIFAKENLAGSHFFFFLYGLGQAILEIAFFIFAGFFIRKYLGLLSFAVFIGGTFVISIVHVLDFLMNRILDLSFWKTLQIFVFEESWANFLYLLDASGVPFWAWLVIFVVLGALPLLGFLIYQVSAWISEKKPLFFRHGIFLQSFVCIPCALLFWDFSASKMIHPDSYTALLKSLPWKCTFLRPQSTTLSLSSPPKRLPDEMSVASALEEIDLEIAHKPNIYLLIMESLREDMITQEVAPHLHQFKNTYAHFPTALSNGNGTHLSWFSIFFSQFPHFWQQAQQSWKLGSPALLLLKKMGYDIRVYSSAQLGYYGMDQLIFGNQNYLIDELQNFHHIPPESAADTDAAALAKLQKDLVENPSLQEGQLFIIFLDCTHFDYKWPKNWIPKFKPFSQEFDYFKAFQSKKTIHQIKNRYRNALNYMDHLFGRFFHSLPRQEESIVVVTGDHGEEFFERGHLFHNSHLTKEQTHIPLYFKFGNQERSPLSRPLVSQMDIFPSLIDYLGGITPPFLEGSSLFRESTWPFVITARFNAGRPPHEFAIHNGKNKLIAQFSNEQQLHIVSLRSADDQSIPEFKSNVEFWVWKEFGPALKRLF